MVNAAKLCILIHWGTTHTPSLSEWFIRLQKIADMEELISLAKDSTSKFTATWGC